MNINGKKIKTSGSIVFGLLVAFFAQRWFEKAYEQPSDIKILIMLFFSLVVLMTIVYFNLDENGNFWA